MASPGRCGNEWRIDDVEAVRRAGGPFALGYPVVAAPPPHHIPQLQLSTPPVVIPTGGEAPFPATPRSRTKRSRLEKVGGVLALIVFLLVAAIFGCLLVSAGLDKPHRGPDFRVRDFAVSNFSISGRGLGLATTWEANISVFNSNRGFTFDLTNIYSVVYYRNANGQLSLSHEEPLHLNVNSTAYVTVKARVTGSETQDAVVIEEIRQELRGNSTLSFNLGVHFKQSWNWYDGYSNRGPNDGEGVTMYCEGLNVAIRFAGDVGFGTLYLPANNRSSGVSCGAYYCSDDDTTLYC